MTTHCFYHSADLDGHCSGAIILSATPDAVMHGINYGDGFPWDDLHPGDVVFMVDFSLQPFEQMLRLNSLVELVWIDHHESAIAERDKSGVIFRGRQEVGRAACELCWEYCWHPWPLPLSVLLLGRYDVWDLENSDVLPFQWFMRSHPETRPGVVGDSFWPRVFRWELGEIADGVAKGQALLDFQAQENAKYCRAYAFDAELDGLRVVAANRGLPNSQVFASVYDPTKHDAMCAFVRRHDGSWSVHLYSDKPSVNIAEFCKEHGGGGHRGAGGFQTDKCPF